MSKQSTYFFNSKCAMIKHKNNNFSVASIKMFLMMAFLAFSLVGYAQDAKRVVKGNVIDKEGTPLIGASVVVKGTTHGVVSDVDGNYSITVSDKYTVLEFRYLGYVPREIEVGNRSVLNVTLELDEGQFEDVVVVGYGTQKKASVVGSITTVKPAQLRTGTSRSLSNNLAGNVAGVLAVQRSGEPGYDNSDFWIRGISTFGNAKNPLVLVDGIERSLNNIETEEIESFSVLKDAAASAVYGVRGANGVILITTKRGKVGKPEIRVRVEQAMTEPVKLPKFLNAPDYMQTLNDISLSNGGKMLYDPQRIEYSRNGYDRDLYPDVNWIDEITKKHANNGRVTLDITGGTEKLRYAFVGGFYHEGGIIERDKSKAWDSSLKVQRYTMRSNVDYDLTPSTLVRFNIGGYLQDRNAPSNAIDNLFAGAFTTPPHIHPTRYSTGEIPREIERANPWAQATQTGYGRSNQFKLETLFSVEQDLRIITPGLKLKGTFSFDRYAGNGVMRKKSPTYYNIATDRDPETGQLDLVINHFGEEFLGYTTSSEWGNRNVYLEGNLSYNRSFGLHAVDAMFMYNQSHKDWGDKVPGRVQGIAGRTAYTYNGRYIAEFNFGYNGTENFTKKNRFGFFPSAALGWIASEESFMEPVRNTVSKLKFRASRGLVGNDGIDGRFGWLSTIDETNGYTWGYDGSVYYNGKREGEIGNPNLKWETVTKTNLGVELGLFNSLELQVDWFKENRKDIYMKRKNIPNSAGFWNMPKTNYGKVKNEGVEVTLDFHKQIGRDWQISARGTLTYAKNKIIEQDEDMGIIGTSRSSTGYPVGQLFGYVAERLYTEDDFANAGNTVLNDGLPIPKLGPNVRPGDIKYVDINGDGVIDDYDKTAIGGTENPEIVYGFGFSVAYKDFDLGAFFQGNGRTYRIIGRGHDFFPGANRGTTGNIYDNASDRWTPENPSQDVFYPRQDIGVNTHNNVESTWWLRNMSMLRLKNIELGYNLPKPVLRKVAMKSARVFLRGTNLLTFSDFKLWDPELKTANNNGLQYPMMKSYSIGLEINF